MRRFSLAFLLLAASIFGAEFQSGQAARAVLGQSSFSSRDPGVKIQSMALSGTHLYAADANRQLLTFDLSRIPDRRADLAVRDASGCLLCGFSPVNASAESVLPGIAAAAHWGKTIAIADSANHRVLIWRDSSSAHAYRGPDVILGQSADSFLPGPTTLVNPVSVALDGKRLFVGDAALHRVLVWNSLPVTNDQPADAVLGQPDFSSSNTGELPTADSLILPAALLSDGLNLFVADPASRRILVFSPADFALPADAVVNSASLGPGPLGPGTLISVGVSGVASQPDAEPADDNQVLPLRLGGMELIFDGQALPLLAVSAQQVQAQLPFALEGRNSANLYLRSARNDGSVTTSTPVALKLVPAAPGLFAFHGSEPRGGILLHTGTTGDTGGPPVTQENPAHSAEIVTVWAAGLGTVADGNNGLSALAGLPFAGPAASVATPVTAQINGQSATVLSAKLPKDSIGVYEVKIIIPESTAESGLSHLAISQNGITSNTVTFSAGPERQ